MSKKHQTQTQFTDSQELNQLIRQLFSNEPVQTKPLGLPEPTTRLGKLVKKLYGCLGGYVIILVILHVLLWNLVPLTSGWSLTITAVVMTILYVKTRVLNLRVWMLIEAPWYTDRDSKAGVLIGIVWPLTIVLLLIQGLAASGYYLM